MTVVLVCTSFNYFLIAFELKYIPGNIYLNSIIASTCEMIFIICSLHILNLIGIKRSIIMGFFISICGGIPLILIKGETDAVPAFLLMCKVGITFNLNVVYLAFSMLFPPIFAQTAFGVAKFIARIVTIAAPVAAELKSPTPMGIFVFLSLLAGNIACFIRQKKREKKKKKGGKNKD